MKKSDQKGQSLVEVALALPLLLLILLGILDLGRAYFTFIALSDAAAEGASYAAIHPDDTTQIVERTTDTSSGLVVIEPAMVTVDNTSLSAGNPITVTILYDYDLLTPILSRFGPDGTITMRAVVAQSIISGAH